MIIVEEKTLGGDFGVPRRVQKILVVGCDGCTQPPRGLRQTETYASLVEVGRRMKGEEAECGATTVSMQCCNDGLLRQLKPDGYDAILSMACGIGAQTITEVFPDIPAYPAQNTFFIGSEEERGYRIRKMHGMWGLPFSGDRWSLPPYEMCKKFSQRTLWWYLRR